MPNRSGILSDRNQSIRALLGLSFLQDFMCERFIAATVVGKTAMVISKKHSRDLPTHFKG